MFISNLRILSTDTRLMVMFLDALLIEKKLENLITLSYKGEKLF